MIYCTFDTKESAVNALLIIADNVKQWCVANAPDALSADGSQLRSRNAATGEWMDAYTSAWAIPEKTAADLWVFPKPTADKTAPIPLDDFIKNVESTEAEYDPAWFPRPEEPAD